MTYLFFGLAFILAYFLTAVMLKFSRSRLLLDYPNARSSHSIPTPRGGGLSVVLTCSLGVVFLFLTQAIEWHLALVLIVGGGAIAAIGFLDDRGSLSVKARIFVHVAAALFAMCALGGLPPLQFGERFLDLGIFGYFLGALGTVWVLNLFNFMDGIDGIAASETIFVTASAGGIAYVTGSPSSIMVAAGLLAVSCSGFLVWNWPPAKIFMGDVCSGYLGYVVAVLAIADARERPSALFVWLTLSAVFFVDATTTLIRRLIRHEKIYEAHRSHAYQWLSRRWNSHLAVTVLVQLINVIWLLPLAWFCIRCPNQAWLIAPLAFSVLTILVLLAGAGRRE